VSAQPQGTHQRRAPQRLSRSPAADCAVAAPTTLPVIQGGLLLTEETAPLTPALLSKLVRLEAAIRARRGVLVAYSGGVDSTLIAAAAVRAVGPHQGDPGQGALAVLADSTTLARRELTLARAVADQIQIPLREVQYSELENPAWAVNDGERCYHCKHDLASELLKLAPEHGYAPEQIAFGTTTTDLGDHRPGLRAIADAAAWQPLVEADLSKAEVRALAKHLDLPVWDKPATPCLASRVQYGEAITAATLERVERAEEALRDMGFRVLRVRHHDRLARIEVPAADLERALGARERIISALKAAGYTYVTLDLVGHRSGAMNEAIGRGRT
jgi:pyridinium-3,5-biscarboxylic acid mononucleotide sulfurtransferase